MEASLQNEVWQRARGACEYCRIHHLLVPLAFQIDHIIARQHGGPTSIENLALACMACNNHKGPNIAGIDPAGAQQGGGRLFHPRQDRWNEHFE